MKCLHLELSSEGRYAAAMALAGKRATADRIRVRTVPEYLEGKGNGPFCGEMLRIFGPYVVGGQLVYRDQEIRETCSRKRALPTLCCSHGGPGVASTGRRSEEASDERVAGKKSSMTPWGFSPERTGN